ncbi:MAG: hypothetical protein J6V47_03450 [Bacteroidaceae bacterium]|nr:hypothetical protein [Bacteroidaceae bacterium]
MYSVNFNEEENNKKKKAHKSLFPENVNDLGVKENETFKQNLAGNGVLLQNTSGADTYAKDDVINNTVFASSMLKKDKEKPVSTLSVADSVDTKKTINSQLSSKEVLGANYNKPGSWGKYLKSVAPEPTPQRTAALYSVSKKAVEDIASDYLKNELKAVYDKKLEAARIHSNNAYAEYGTDAIAAMRIAQERSDPMAVIDETMKEVDAGKLRKMVEPLALRGGFDADEYIEDYVKPTLHDMMLNDYIDKNKPKNSAEYMLRAAYDGSLIGKAANIGLGRSSFAQIENESLARYGASRLENFAAGIGSLLIDAPAFASFGALSGRIVGKATSYATNKLAERLLSYSAADGMTKLRASQIAQRAIVGNLSNRIMQSATTQGLTLGTYDLANSVAEDVLYNDCVDTGKAFKSFAKGFGTGATAGAVGTRLKKMMGGLTGGKKMLASTGVLSAESAVFTLSTEMDKVLNDVEVKPIDLFNDYAESLATLGVMKMTHWRPKGAENKLKADGTLKDELKLSKSEQEELREMNIDPVEFMGYVEKSLNLPSYGVGATRNHITEKYLEMMQSKDVSATTKAKLMYLIDNKLTSTPPVPFDYDVEQNRKGEWVYTTYDFEGNKVERRLFEHAGKVKNHLLVEKSKLRNNRIAAYERELLQGIDSQNLLRQAGLYAKEKSVSIDDISQALYKRAQNTPLSGWEDMLVREIVDRASYDQSGMVQFLTDMRRNIEKKHGLDDGSMLTKINTPFYKCTNAENKALDEYEALVRNEVNALKQGTDKERAAQLREIGENSSLKGMANDEVKRKEVEDFYTRNPDKIDAVGSGFKEKPIEIDDNEPSEFVWSYNGTENTVEDIEYFKDVAQDVAGRFNFDIGFIKNEREIPLPDTNDKYDVMNYNNKLRAMGWLDKKGGITINLPNIPSVEEIEKTVVHECVAHGGLQKLFGNHLNTFLEEVYRKASGDVRVAINNIQSRYPFADNYTVIEEYLAHLTEKSVLSSGERAMFADFKDFVKNALVRMNIYTGRNRRVTENDLKSLLRQHAKYIEKRTAPSNYRRWVFGRFDAAKQNEKTYYDREAYENDIREKMAGGKFFINTPSALYNTKALQNYEFLPEEKKKQFLKRWNTTDEEVMELKSQNKHRFIGKKGADNKAYYEGLEDGDPELAEAIELEKKGYDSNSIRFATGWERGVDNEWRKEMSDGRMTIHDQLYKSLARKNKDLANDYLELKSIPLEAWGYDENAVWERARRESGNFLENSTLKDILHDPSFYATYPELANLPVEIVENAKVPFRYDSKGKKILLDKSFFVHPENSVYMSGVLQNVIQDYEGFSKAVSMNLLGINSKLKRRYNEAQKIIDAVANARRAVPDFDKERNIDKAFEKEYKLTPEEFKKRFPSLDEYLIYKLTGKDFAFSGDVEMRNVMNRFDAGDYDGRVIPPETTEDVPRSKQVVIKKLNDLKPYFNGPLDIIYQKLNQLHSDEPLLLENVKERVRRADLSPVERGRFEWEMDEYAKEVLDRMLNMGKWKNDYGYGEFKKKQDDKKRRLRDAVDFQKWRDIFRHLDDELDDLN